MHSGDLPQLESIQTLCYPAHYLESAAVLRARFARAPRTAWVAAVGELAQAYLVGYPSRLQRIAPLNSVFVPSAEADTLYLHDLAVAPTLAGQGVGPRLVALALDAARAAGLRHAALVAVGNAAPFWQRQQFVPHRLVSPAATAALASYGSEAVYMTRPL